MTVSPYSSHVYTFSSGNVNYPRQLPIKC